MGNPKSLSTARPKLVRITTIPLSMKVLLKGQLQYMTQQGYEVIAISAAGKEGDELSKNENCSFQSIPFVRNINPLVDLICLIKLIKLLKKIKPDIVHTHTPKAGLIGMWAAYITGVPIRLHTVAGLVWIEKKGIIKMILKWVEHLTVFPATRVYPNSINLLKFMQLHKIGNEKIHVIANGTSNGIDTDYFRLNDAHISFGQKIRSEKRTDESAFVWLYIGRLVYDKGIYELLDAFIRLNQTHTKDQLWLVGDLESDLNPLIVEHLNLINHHPSIHYFGFDYNVRPYLSAAQVLVFPSYREGFPNVPLQAASMGCKLILSDINGCNEMFSDNDDCCLIESKNSKALYQSMLSFRNTSPAPERSNFLRETVKKKYDQQLVWSSISKEYASLLSAS